MLKHKDLVGKLTDAQKILILSDIQSLSRRELKRFGLSPLKSGNVDDYLRSVYPRASVIANSFDDELIGSVASDIMSAMYKDGVELASLPSAKVKINPYKEALSEDPMLSSNVARAYLKAANAKGLAINMSECSIDNDDVVWMDKSPNKRAIEEHIVKPHLNAVKGLDCNALEMSDDPLNERYKGENIKLVEKLSTLGNSFLICERASEKNTVKLLSDGVVCLRSSGYAIDSAHARYKELRRMVDKGELEELEISNEIEVGKAISTEMIDLAVDRVFDFILSCREGKLGSMDGGVVRDKLAAKSVRESAVMLKNKSKILPLSKKEKLFVIGDMKTPLGESIAEACAESLKLNGYNCIGWAQGYEISKSRSEMSLGEAYNLSEAADKIVLLLGRSEALEKDIVKSRNLELPANQVALARRLASRGKNVVAVVSTGYGFDIEAVEEFDGIITMSLETAYSADALVDILTGVYNPSGRLASTLYRNTEKSFAKQSYYRKKGSRSGIFTGYRYYDTAGYDVGFPFGFGMGYSEFTYSRPKHVGDSVSFTLKNIGKYDATEVVQMYVGLETSSVIRPKKELVHYKRISLKAGESQRVSMDISLPEIYDEKNGEFVKEAGTYTVYVGSSVSDIKFSFDYVGGEAAVSGDGEDVIDYLQSASNIVRDKYTLEANYKLMKRTVRNVLSGVILITLAVLLRVYCHSNAIENGFLNIFTLALALLSAGYFIMEIVDRVKLSKDEALLVETANKEYFDDAESVNVFSTDRMFKDEFESDEEAEPTVSDVESMSEEYLRYVDGKFDYLTATKELMLFAAERGCKLDIGTVRDMLASISSSRLMIVKGMSDEDFELLMKLLCEYFGTELHIDKLDETYVDEGSILFENIADHKKRPTMIAIESARAEKHKIHLAGFTNVGVSDISEKLMTFVKYAKSPNGHNSISVGGGSRANTYYIPQNLWIVLNLVDTDNVEDIPEMAVEVGTLNTVKMSKCDEAETTTGVHSFYYYQLDYMAEKTFAKCEVAEGEWKKLDEFVEFVNKDVSFNIGNKQWIGMERYVSVYVECGGEGAVAFDRAIAARLIPSALVASSKNEKRIDLLEGLNVAFGDGEISASRGVINEALQNKTKTQN